MRHIIWVLIVFLVIASALIGRNIGIRHAIENLQLYAIEHNIDTGYRVMIDFDGQVHEYTTH